MTEITVEDEQAMLNLGARLVHAFQAGDIVLFEGELGAGKTTLIRGMLTELGWKEPVRSPTFNLFGVYPTVPPVLHADFYRISSSFGTGIEDYLESHLCLVEWPKALHDLVDYESAMRVMILFEGDARRVQLSNISI